MNSEKEVKTDLNLIAPKERPSDSKFSNNSDSNTLLDKFKTILTNDKNIVHLCFLIGFFRVSGFKILWDFIAPKLTQLESINILVGIEADKFSSSLANLESNPHQKQSVYEAFKKEFARISSDDINKAEYNLDVEESFELLLNAIKDKQIQIRIIKDKNTHAKFYIFTSNPIKTQNTDQYNGSLIVGSSNLSYNGLEKNYEFNLESKDSNDIAYALYEFNELWQSAILLDNPEQLAQQIKEQSYLKECEPKELYYKLLIEYFGENRIKIDDSLKSLFPKNFLVLNYQLAAIQEGLEKLEKYNGFFLSDVVGLGKTLIALIIAKKLKLTREKFDIAIICPKSLMKNWKKHLDLLDIKADVASFDKLDEITKKASSYSLILIDESHNLANHLSKRYENIQEICKRQTPLKERKKIILLSATPLRNCPQDIKNQLLLFQDGTNANIENITDLERFFAPLIAKFNSVKKELKENKDKNKGKKELDKIAEKIRDDLLRFVMIRRTRSDIENIQVFKDDLKAQGLKFPKIKLPKDLNYDLDKKSLNLAKQTLKLLKMEENDIGRFGYYRYLIYPNLAPSGQAKFKEHYEKDSENFIKKAEQLQALMQVLLFKRFDSSFEAFKESLAVQIKSLQAFLKMFEKGQIGIPKKLNDLYKFYDEILENEDLGQVLQNYEEKGKLFFLNIEDFKEDFKDNLQSDLNTVSSLHSLWQEITKDTKFERLQNLLEDCKGKKVIIFTEAKASANYLEKKLSHLKILKIDANNRDEHYEEIASNFDANYEIKKDDYEILISTDTLAEGINLHRSNIIINYDSPWGITKLMQRIGRINRIGTRHEEIHIYNFKPTDLSDEILKFTHIAYQKLQSFHLTLGEDSAIYDESEEVESKKLFEKIQSEDDEESPDVEFLNDIQTLYNENRTEYERIKGIKPKSRTFIDDEPRSFCYLKNEQGNSFFYEVKENKIENLSFLTMASYLKNHLQSPALKPSIKQKQSHYKDIKSILSKHNAKESLFDEESIQLNSGKISPKINQALAKIRNCEFLSPDQKVLIEEVIKKGILQALIKDIDKAKSFDDYEKIYARCKDLHQDNSTKKSPLQQVKIELSISAFKKE